ncbi:zinc ABC transporter substrate-binding protein (plasmid) [Pediococcus parvulus]|uniref:metal ABC transporter solute-binding protein, Zn/Mn family n=1 Tax=Pediococcus TaxID=1253 RepID=UPI0012ED90A9|nr:MULTISPECIES: zinc ABC transporter substrate-binding protein [Pediococcus]MDV7720328.1 metal ABC transporter substrate-binding protein [Pediococcus ethanolidurans]
MIFTKIKHNLFLPVILLLVILLGGLLTACSNSKSLNTDNKIKIIASTDFYGAAAKAVVGNKGQVTSVIKKPSIDPHDYDPTTNVAKQVSKANVVIANGIGYDVWMNKLVKSNNTSTKYIRIGEDVMNKQLGDNPHIWYNPETMPKYVNYLADKLSKMQPKNKSYFHKNANKYVKSLQSVNNEIKKLKKQTTNKSKNKVYVSEPVFDYALEALGYKVINKNFENAMEKGIDPSTKQIKEMQYGIKEHKIAFFVYNKQVSSKTVTNFVHLAKQYKVPVLKVTETLPANMTYKQWMLSQYRQLSSILSEQNK